MTTEPAGVRGSDKLFDRLRPRPIEDKALRQLFTVFDKLQVDIDDYFPIGRPAFELVRAKATLKRHGLAQLLGELNRIDGLELHGVRGFPKGLPPLEREMVVELEFTAGAR